MNISLPSELDEWVNSRADEIGVEPELLIQQLIDSYRTQTPENAPEPVEQSRDSVGELEAAVVGALVEEKLESWLDGELDEAIEGRVGAALDGRVATAVEETVDQQVESVVDETVEHRVEAAVEERVEAILPEALDERLDDRLEVAIADLELEDEDLRERLEALESKQEADLADVRERVVQIKKETDKKTPLQEFEETRKTVAAVELALDAVEGRLDAIAGSVDEIGGAVDELCDLEPTVEHLEGTLSESRDRLNTLAWNVRDLRARADALEDLDRLKRTAAERDIERAKCENCDTGVSVGLLTEPACPHCDASVTDVAEASSFFGKPRLRTTPE